MRTLTDVIRAKVVQWLDRRQPPETVIVGGLAVLVGGLSALGVWLFKRLIDLFHTLAFEQLGRGLAGWGPWTVILLPVLGGLAVGLLKRYWIGTERHHGVAGIMEAVALAGGRLRYRRLPAKVLAAALSIGSGAAVGPEDPSVQIGANLGSLFGQGLRVSDERVRGLVAAGAAAGVAAAFNAPIAGVFFALEIILGEIGGAAFGVTLLAAVVSAVITQLLSGPQPAFGIPAYAFNSAWELPLYLGLGVLAGPVAAAYVRLIYFWHDQFHRLRPIPEWLRPALAGLAVGAVGVWLPGVFGVGYETIERVLQGEALGLPLLAGLLVAKLVLTPVSLGGGFQGGTFAPALFVGAMLGGAYGTLAAQWFPALAIAPPAFAMVGMAAVLAGAVHAPLTAILLLFEMTHDYRIILPLMFAVGVSLWTAQRLQRDSVYALGLARKGIRLERGRDVEVLETLTVGEVMRTEPAVLSVDDTLETASRRLLQERQHGLPVVDAAGALAGILTVQDLDQTPLEGRDAERVGAVCTRDLLVTYPDESVGAALRRMSVRDVGRLPVVDRAQPRQLVGLLRRVDLVRAYDVALARRAELRHRAGQVQLGAITGVQVGEYRLAAGAPCVDKPLKETAWPRESVIASLRRGRQTLIPHGDTVLRAGDVLAVVAAPEAQAALEQLCAPASPPG